MVNEKEKEASKEKNQNKYQFGPGIGIIILGLSYVIWWVMPWAWKSYAEDPRWAHNWAYSIIILTVGLAWYQKTPISRTVAMIQSFMMPITAAGAIDSLICTYITIGFLFCWLGLVIYERKTEKTLYKEKMEPRTVNWVNMHTMILAWILIGHIGLLFFLARAPFEVQFLNIEELYGVRPGFLQNLPPEHHEYATWTFDIGLTIWMVLIVYEQFKMGYNFKNKPWPKWSFWWTIVGLMVIPLIALAIQFG